MSLIHFIGIDISKNTFEAALCTNLAKCQRFTNDAAGIRAFLKDWKPVLAQALVVLEATGGYETALLVDLVSKNIAVHRADPLTAKHFIASLGKKAKTDRLDAIALARYAKERHSELARFRLADDDQRRLSGLMARRDDLVAMRVAETNRLKHPRYAGLEASLQAVLATLGEQILLVEKEVSTLIEENPLLNSKLKVMTAVKGVGHKVACVLLAALPELGRLTPKTAASLAGCAPHPKDSGTLSRYRRTFAGRALVKRSLFLAAMAARRYNPTLKIFYERLIANGKKPMIALTALMRKLVVILNAKLRDAQLQTSW